MSRARRVALIFIASLLTVGWTSPLREEGTVVVGRVTNGSTGGIVPADLTVTLHVFSEMGEEEIGTYTTAISAHGSFRFDELVWESDAVFVTRVVYQGVAYTSEFAVPEPGQRELSLPIVIYESTENRDDIQVGQLHIFAARVGNRLRISEYHVVGNAGDRTYVGSVDAETGRRITLAFALPEGATGLSFEAAGLGERFVERPGGFADTFPIVPGSASSEVFYHYELPYRQTVRIRRVFEVPVVSIVLLLSGEGMMLQGEGMAPAGALETEEGLALSYEAGPLAAGEPLAFTLTSATRSAPVAPSGISPGRDVASEVIIGLVALCVAVIAVYLLWRPATSTAVYPALPPTQVRPLIESISALDVDFEAGRLTEGAYRRERMALKQRVRALLEGSRGTEQAEEHEAAVDVDD